MSIVKMKHLSIIGLESDKEAMLSCLMELGAVELKDQSSKLLDQDWASIVHRDGEADRVALTEGELARVQVALDTLERYDTAKKPLFSTRKPITDAQYKAVLGDEEKIRQNVQHIVELHEEWNLCRTEENAIDSSCVALKPWSAYDLPLEMTETKTVMISCGVIPAVADVETLKKQVTKVNEATEVTVLGRDEEQIYLNVLCLKADEEAVLDVLKGYGYSVAAFKGMIGTVSENFARLDARKQELKKQEADIEEKIRQSLIHKEEICYYSDSLRIARDQAKASEQLLRTQKAFFLDGWLIAEREEELKAAVESCQCICDIRDPEKGEETPVLLKNVDALAPFEANTSMYALPRSYEVDPTPIFAVFYFIFFGMMFADMAYGLLLAGACFTLLKLYRMEGTGYRLIKCMGYCGISTFIWGALFGGFFGDLISVVSGTFFGHEITITPLWFDPLSNPMKLLIFSCVLGTVHLFVGMGIKAYMQIREGKWLDAISEVFAWYAFIIGAALLLFGSSLFAGATVIGKWMAIAGAAIIVGAPLIRNKGIGKLLGLWDLYGCTGYLADILSYSRLLALGLASAVIAQVFNQLGSLAGSSIIGVIFFVLVALIGHSLNFAINALGSYVHTSRLQYVEFFGKFYEGGGDEFRPFEKKTKFVNIIKED